MPAVEVKYTYQDLRSTPDDGRRYELFEGDLIVSPAPTTMHQRIVFRLSLVIGNFVQMHQLGEVLSAPCDIQFSGETVVEPDLLFVARDRASIVKEDYVQGAPDLIVEVISPTSEERDRGYKFKIYAEQGVKEYWLADYRKRVLQIFGLTSSGFQLAGEFKNDDEVRSPLFPGLRFRVSELWK
jgi:Uma2 family endonuclease